MITRRAAARLASTSDPSQSVHTSKPDYFPAASQQVIMSKEDNSEAILKRLEELSAEFKLVRQEMRQSVEFAIETAVEAKQIAQDAKLQVSNLQTELNKVCLENAHLKSEVTLMKDTMLRQEEYSRRSNVLLHGIEEVDSERPNDCLSRVYEVLTDIGLDDPKSTIKIERCHRLGPKPKPSRLKPRPRPIIFKLNWYMDKEKIMSHASNLDRGLRLTSDFPAVIQQRRSTLFPIYYAAKRQGKNPRMPSDRLYIGNKVYTVDNMKDLPHDLQPDVASIRSIGNVKAFFGKQCPLSNFYPAPFMVDGINYKTSEHYLQHKKALLMKDDQIATKILTAETPDMCKSLAREIKNMDWQKWSDEASELVKPGLLEKFRQNEKCLSCLLNTESSILAEASPTDKLWGIGLHIGHPDAADQTKWTGTNLMGQLLQEVRETLKS